MGEGGTGPEGENEGQTPLCCHQHPHNRATALCVSCSKPVCQECDQRDGYLHYCPECRPFAYMPPPPPIIPLEPLDERERRWWRADWSPKEVLIALFIIFFIYSLVGMVFFFIFRDVESILFYNYIAYVVSFCPLIGLSAWILVRRRHDRGLDELGIRWGKPGRVLLFGGLGGLAALVISYGAYLLVFLIFYALTGRGPVSGESEMLKEMGTGTMVLTIVVTVILAPIFEELFFRGLFYPALRRRLGVRFAIILDGAIFGALHYQPIFMFSLIFVGMLLAYIYEKTDSLIAPIMTHAIYNLVVVMITIFIK